MKKKGGQKIDYEMKLKLNDRQYIAVLDKALVIVTTDEDGKPIRKEISEDDFHAIMA